MGFNGIIWDENESQSYPQAFVENNAGITGAYKQQLIVF
jgi:hypothetical protein